MGRGRARVLAIRASIFSSIKQLKAAAAPDTNPIPRIALINKFNGTMPGVDKNIPMTAVKTIRAFTLGLQRAKKDFRFSIEQ
jgi:hypothetical protein